MRFLKTPVSLLLVLPALLSLASTGRADEQAAWAMPEPLAGEVVGQVLMSGGNAVDAAIAGAFALAVTMPDAGNLGGGGFMLARMAGSAFFLDYRETAPAEADRDMYLDGDGEVIPDASLVGALAAGVPGTVAGMWEAHQRLGSLAWADLLAPAIKLARDGFVVDEVLAREIRDFASELSGRTNFDLYFGQLKPGDRFKQPELANTLERIAKRGKSGFYEGETASLLLAQMQRGGGLISAGDLADYRAVWRQPLQVEWRNFTILTAPPPSSGGIALIQLLRMKDILATEFSGQEHNSVRYIHLVAEIEKRVFADRAKYGGDPAFWQVPVADLIDEQYLERRAGEVDARSISPGDKVRPGLQAHQTTHFSIQDFQGNAVSNTYTLNGSFGSGVVVEGAGFLLNNEMDDFSAKPGAPNLYGVVGDAANAIAPGKRMLSSMTPTILLQDGRPMAIIGTMGGSTIFTSVFQVLLNMLDFGMPPDQAVAATRFHHQLLPADQITYDPELPLPAKTLDGLRALGYRPVPHPWQLGDVHVVSSLDGTLRAAADPRWRGASRVLVRALSP